MGVIIFTHDPTKYRVGEYIESKDFSCSPNVEGLTVIVHAKKPTEAEALDWLSLVAYRLIWVCDNPPQIKDDRVIYETISEKNGWERGVVAVLRWRDRRRAYRESLKTPIPVILSYLRENIKDITLWRKIAHAFTHTPEEMQRALLVFSYDTEGGWRMKRAFNDEKPDPPNGFRESDKYAESIIRGSIPCANEMRRISPSSMPKGMKKREQAESGWL